MDYYRELSNRLLIQTRTDSQKLYSIHEPHVDCILNGKSNKGYEFDNAVGVMVINRSNWIIGTQALCRNPFDAPTLAKAAEQMQKTDYCYLEVDLDG